MNINLTSCQDISNDFFEVAKNRRRHSRERVLIFFGNSLLRSFNLLKIYAARPSDRARDSECFPQRQTAVAVSKKAFTSTWFLDRIRSVIRAPPLAVCENRIGAAGGRIGRSQLLSYLAVLPVQLHVSSDLHQG